MLGGDAAAAAAEEERRGTLAALRRVSARLFFGDLECDADADAPAMALVFKRERWCVRLVGPRGAERRFTARPRARSPELDALRRELRQGDLVLVRGVRDDPPAGALRVRAAPPPTVARCEGGRLTRAAGPPTLVVTSCAVLRAWRDASPHVPFVPRPMPKPAAASAPESAPPADATACKFWVNTGRCALGSRCAARHDGGGRDAWVAERRAGRARLAAASGDPHASAAPAKAARAAAFADFLVATYGLEALRAGCGVVDVAGGGAGGVAFELHCRYGVRTTVVDPRPPVLCRRTAATVAKGCGANGPTLPPPTTTAHPEHCAALFDVALAQARFADAAAVVGMHPDQATDAVVEAALALGCPFAVVPCCVFPSLFAHARRTPDGSRVTSRCGPAFASHTAACTGFATKPPWLTTLLALVRAGSSWLSTCWHGRPGRAPRGCRSKAQTAWSSRHHTPHKQCLLPSEPPLNALPQRRCAAELTRMSHMPP